jgi:hypothetical protein
MQPHNSTFPILRRQHNNILFVHSARRFSSSCTALQRRAEFAYRPKVTCIASANKSTTLELPAARGKIYSATSLRLWILFWQPLRMSFLGGAECSTAGNPLSQFTKHVQDDKSLQRDRLVGRGPGGSMQGMRSTGGMNMSGSQDNVSTVTGLRGSVSKGVALLVRCNLLTRSRR